MKILVKITKAVLEATKNCGRSSEKKYSNSCGIAYAIREIIPTAQVDYTDDEKSAYIEIPATFGVIRMTLPDEAYDFMKRFDLCISYPHLGTEYLTPTSFEIDIPDNVIEHYVGLSEIYKVLSESETLEHINP